jgi:hypothetical protein
MPIAIESWSASDTADADGEYVFIVGREAGLAGLLLASAGTVATTRLTIDGQRVRFERRSLCGSTLRTTPLVNVASAACGECRPWREALILVLAGLPALALPGTGWVLTTVMVLLAAAYCLISSRLYIEIADRGSCVVRIEFAAATTDGEHIDENARKKLVDVVEMLMLGGLAAGGSFERKPAVAAGTASAAAAASRRSHRSRVPTDAVPAFGASGASASAAFAGATPDQGLAGKHLDSKSSEAGGTSSPIRLNCPSCGASVQVNDGFCGACGHKLPFLPQ